MNQISHEEYFFALLRKVGLLCGYQVDQMDYELYTEEMQWCGYEAGIAGLKEIIRNRKGYEKFPSPSQIREASGEMVASSRSVSSLDTGIEVANRILAGIRQFGYVNPKRAEQHIGEIGWRVVRAVGGWSSLCDIRESDLQIAWAHWRDTARGFVEKSLRGDDMDAPPCFPKTAEQAKSQTVLGEAMKILDDVTKLN